MSLSAAVDGDLAEAGSSFRRQCRDIAARLRRRALGAFVAVPLALIALIAIPSPASAHVFSSAVLVVAALLTSLTSLGLSGLLLFDAALFTWMAGFADEPAACLAVDRFLAEAKLKQPAAATRPVAVRIEGAQRLLRRQGAASVAAIVACLLAIAVKIA